MLNLFLALLLASFGSNVLAEQKDDDDNKIGEAVDRIQRCCRFLFRLIIQLFCGKKQDSSKITESNTTETIYFNQVCSVIKYFPSSFHYVFQTFSLWLVQII